MSVAGYEKVKTKVIEGKKKCIYKKHKGTKLYVKGFGKMRSVESYIKLCKKAAASKASKPNKAKKTRSKSAKKYGGFLQEFFANMGEEAFSEKEKPKGDKFSSPPANSTNVHKSHQEALPSTTSKTEAFNAHDQKMGGSSCSKKGGDGDKDGVQADILIRLWGGSGWIYHRFVKNEQNKLKLSREGPPAHWIDGAGNTLESENLSNGAKLYLVNSHASKEGGRHRKKGGDGKHEGILIRLEKGGAYYYHMFVENDENKLELVQGRTVSGSYYWKDGNNNTFKSEHSLQGAILNLVNTPASEEQEGGRRRKRNKVPKSMLDKLMMAATFRKRSVKKGKKYHRKGGNLFSNMGLMGGQSQTNY